jgi:hypothetical protein
VLGKSAELYPALQERRYSITINDKGNDGHEWGQGMARVLRRLEMDIWSLVMSVVLGETVVRRPKIPMYST